MAITGKRLGQTWYYGLGLGILLAGLLYAAAYAYLPNFEMKQRLEAEGGLDG
jgi:hypothetical protein